MKALRLHDRRSFDGLAIDDAPEPRPAEGEVLIAVHAAAITPTELQWVPTSSQPDGTPRPLPLVLGHEFSGTVRALGPGVRDLAIGDAVYGMNDWFRDGAQAECCVARAAEVAPKPRAIDHVAAATVPISALTAWQSLVDRARIHAGQRVLIHGAAGGVGLFAVQLAHRAGAVVLATASAANLDFVRALGADHAVDYRSPRFEDAVGTVDVVFDTVGGETLERSWSVLAPGGTLVTVAASAEHTTSARDQQAFFIVTPDRRQLEEIARLIDAGELRTVVGAVFPLAEGRAAYAAKAAHGKIVLRVVD